MPLSIHKRPATSKIQPMKLRGRLEAIRAPTRGKAKKGKRSKSPPMVRSAPQLLGTSAPRARAYSGMRAKNIATEREASDQASQVVVRGLIPPTLLPRSLDPSATATLYSTIASQALRQPSRGDSSDARNHRKFVTEFTLKHKPLRYGIDGSIIDVRRVYEEEDRASDDDIVARHAAHRGRRRAARGRHAQGDRAPRLPGRHPEAARARRAGRAALARIQPDQGARRPAPSPLFAGRGPRAGLARGRPAERRSGRGWGMGGRGPFPRASGRMPDARPSRGRGLPRVPAPALRGGGALPRRFSGRVRPARQRRLRRLAVLPGGGAARRAGRRAGEAQPRPRRARRVGRGDLV